MTRIQTYVFIDLEPTGMPEEECNRTKITELCMIAVKRTHMLDTRGGAIPRVQQKITLCLNPGRLIYPSCTDVTGLSNELLEYEPYFNYEIFNILDNFLRLLQKPVCLIAHNGLNFDYPILKNHLVKLGVSFPDDLLCIDTLHAFYHIEERSNDYTDIAAETFANLSNINKDNMQFTNEKTPQKLIQKQPLMAPSKSYLNNKPYKYKLNDPKNDTDIQLDVERASMKSIKKDLFPPACQYFTPTKHCFPWPRGNKPTRKYKLKYVYRRFFGHPSPHRAHRAENDCLTLLQCVSIMGEQFYDYADTNYRKFCEIKPMKIGVPIGQ